MIVKKNLTFAKIRISWVEVIKELRKEKEQESLMEIHVQSQKDGKIIIALAL
jgi:hypothetical protein